MDRPTYGIVGRGRVATHITRYLELESRRTVTWHRGMTRPPAEALHEAQFILLAISDDALAPFLGQHFELAAREVVHFSGAISLPGTSGMHPLMTFGPELYDREAYRAIPFVTERGGKSFCDVFPALPNPFYVIEPEQKAFYHALCVLAGNFPTMLWGKAFESFEKSLGLPRDALAPYLSRTLENSLASGARALTGPIARGDMGTVQNNLAALGDDPFADVYRAFARAAGIQETRT